MLHKLLLLFLMLWSITQAGAAVVPNGDFEKGIKPWKPYRGNWREPFFTPEVTPCQEPGHGGFAALVKAENAVRAAGISMEVKLPANEKRFWISMQIKVEDIKDGWVQMYLQRRAVLPDGQKKNINLWIKGTLPTHRGGGVLPWTVFSGEFTLPDDLPAGRDFLILRFGGANVSGRVLFDNISIEPVSARKKSADQGRINARPSGVNLIRDHWSYRTFDDCAGIRQNGNNFTADIPAGKRAMWNYTVYSIYDNIQGPMRFSFKSRYPVNGRLRCTLFPTEKKNDVVHQAKAVGKADSNGYRTYAVEFTPLPRTGRMVIALTAGNNLHASKMDVKDIVLERLVPDTGKVSLYQVHHGEINNQGLMLKTGVPYSTFQFENASKKIQKLPVKITLSDFYGKKVWEKESVFTLPEQSIGTFKVEYPRLKDPGFYTVAAQWSENGEPARYRGGFVVVEKPLANPDKMFAFSPWDGEIGWQNVDAQRLIGCGLKATAFFGRFVEKSNFKVMEQTLAAAEKNNMQLVGTLIMPPGRFMPGFKPDPAKLKQGKLPYGDDYFQEAAKRVTALAKQYKGRIKYWILYDELDCSVLRYPYAEEHFVKLSKVVCDAFHAVDPDVVVTGLTVTGHDNKAVPRYPLLRKVWPQLKNHFDGLSLDAYSSGNTFGPNWVAKDPVNGEFKAIVLDAYKIASADGKKRLSIQERGYARTAGEEIDNSYAINEAKALAADFVLAKSMPELEFMLYFNFRSGNDGPARLFGIMDHENARPAAAVFAAAARRLAHVKFIKQLKLQYQALQCYVFKRGNTTVVPLWISSQPTDFNIKATFRCPAVSGLKLFDMQGVAMPLKKEGGNMILELTAAPLYLETSAPVEVVAKALQQGTCQLPELTMDAMLYRGDTVRSFVKNLTGSALKTRLQLQAAGKTSAQEVTLLPEVITPVDFKLKNLVVPGDTKYKLTAATAGQNYDFNGSLPTLPLRKAPAINELEKLPVLVKMDGRTYINDLDSVANKVWSDDADCSADVRIAYNNKHFLLSVTVYDEKHITPWSGKSIWKGDSIQFAFETTRDAVKRKMLNQTGFIGTDRLYTAALVNGKPEVFVNPGGRKSRAEVQMMRDEKQGKTIYRFAIPWSELNTSPRPGNVIGFALLIADSDWEKRQFQYRLELGRGIDGAFHDPGRLLSLIIE